MLARWLTLMCCIGLMVGCVPPPVEHVDPPIQMRDEARAIPSVTQVYIQGPFNVRLHTNKKQKASVNIRGDVVDLGYIKIHVEKGVLYVSVGGKRAHIGKRKLRLGYADLDINLPRLHGFTYKGEGTITAHKIRANPLDIWIANSGKSTWDGYMNLRHLTLVGTGHTQISGIHSNNLTVRMVGAPEVQLRGEANLRRLDIKGGGWISLYWMKSKYLVIRAAGNARIMTAGVVDRLDAVFSDKTHFDGRYLRAKETFVKTNGEAVADIVTVDKQHTLARDKSDIYYYNLPSLRTDFMARNAAVLDMRSEALRMQQPDTIYNH